jgi:phage terminase large subunit GpA-like protein
MVRARDEKSRRYRYVVKKGARNEVADAETYAYAALLLGPVDRTLLVHEVDRINRLGASLRGDNALTTTTPTPTPAASTMPWVTNRGGWRR